MKTHRAVVRDVKSERFQAGSVRFFVHLVASAAGLGFLALWHGPYSLKGLLLIGGLVIGVVCALAGLSANVLELVRRPEAKPANSLREACLDFYGHAQARAREGRIFFVDACHYSTGDGTEGATHVVRGQSSRRSRAGERGGA